MQESDDRQPQKQPLPKLSRDLITQGYELSDDHARPLRRRERGGRPNRMGTITRLWECPFMDSGDDWYWPVRQKGGIL